MQVLVVGTNPHDAARHSQALCAAGFRTELFPHSAVILEGRAPSRPLVESGHDGAWPSKSKHHPHATLDHLAKLDAGVVVLICPPGACTGACLVRQLRQLGSELLILVVAVRGSAGCWTGCHQAGADDYLEAAADLPALPARVRALMRRSRFSVLGSRLQVGDLSLDVKRRQATRAGQLIDLSPRETELLAYLMRRAGQLCLLKDLLADVWHYQGRSASNVVAKCIERLRENIETGFDTRRIETVPGKGYLFNAEG